MKKLLIVLSCVCLVVGCSSKIDKVIKKNNYIIIDVRTEDEYNKSHVKDSINIPYNQIDNVDLDKRKDILVYCQSGARSKAAYDTLKELGYNVYDLGAYENIKLEKENY